MYAYPLHHSRKISYTMTSVSLEVFFSFLGFSYILFKMIAIFLKRSFFILKCIFFMINIFKQKYACKIYILEWNFNFKSVSKYFTQTTFDAVEKKQLWIFFSRAIHCVSLFLNYFTTFVTTLLYFLNYLICNSFSKLLCV